MMYLEVNKQRTTDVKMQQVMFGNKIQQVSYK